ncbi:MAG TPA: PAS domain S-box protein [Candidatus Limnocylindrales bacterium]|nr:PAS domain S-box protein [Candidatus Limnocylindrales bacterium]
MTDPRGGSARAIDLGDPAALALVEAVAQSIGDATAVTNSDSVVLVWNAEAERLYGIAAGDAVGRSIYDLFDSTIVGQPLRREEPRRITIEAGVWRGRTIDVPRIGSRVGREIAVEAVLSRLSAPDGSFSGIISIKRDITTTVRLERELAALGTLATATGRARSVDELANRAIVALCGATGASAGLIIGHDGDRARVLSAHGLPADAIDLVERPGVSTSPIVRALATPGTVVSESIDVFPMRDASRPVLEAAGIRVVSAVGLHSGDDLTGMFILGWDDPSLALPSSAVLLQAAAHLERALENAGMVEESTARSSAQQALARRLESLNQLTGVGLSVESIEVLAERSATLVNQALEADGTAYGIFTPDRTGYAVSAAVALPEPIREWLVSHPPTDRGAVAHWLAGGGSVLAGFTPAEATAETIEVARRSGVSAYAAIPLRVDNDLVGGIVVYFGRPPDDLPIQPADLDAVGQIASIAFANLQLRRRLIASEQRYRTLFDRSPVPFVLETDDGRIADVNAAAEELYRADRAWLVGRSVDDISGWAEGELARRRAAMAESGRGTFEGTGIRADGSRFPQRVDASAVEVDGETRMLIRVEDLTEHDRLQSELIHAQKMEAIGQLVAGVAHELNNPLASIVAFSQLLRRDPRLPADLQGDADLLVAEADRTRRIVQNLLDFARQRRPERHPTHLRRLVESVLDLQSYSIAAGRIEVVVEIADTVPLVAVDRAQLQQVLLNLTLNAIQAIRSTGEPGSIRITAAAAAGPDGAAVRLEVSDGGPGVPPENRDRLFVPFFTTKEPGEGTGLGLPVSFGIVASHGGTLSFEPGPGGRGATFVVTLPVEDATADAGTGAADAGTGAAEPEAPSPVAASPAAVLVLDDEPSIRAFLGKALQSAGFEPIVVATGADAIAAVRDRPSIAAVLCDYRMAGMNGTEVHERLVAIRPDLRDRFVFMSGDVLNAELASFAAANGATLLAKPFDLDTVQQTVRAVVEGTQRG